MVHHRSRFVLVGVSILGLGCSAGLTDASVCTLEARAGITVDVRDSVSNTPAGKGSRIIAQQGTVADTAQVTQFGDGPYGLVYERAGTYTLSVAQTGYQPWIKTGVQVTKGSCHVNGVAITARLQK
jgi:hypothetical protein